MKVKNAPMATTAPTLRAIGLDVRAAPNGFAVISRFANRGRPPFTTACSGLTEIAEKNLLGHGSPGGRGELPTQEARMNRTALLKSIGALVVAPTAPPVALIAKAAMRRLAFAAPRQMTVAARLSGWAEAG